VLAAQQIVRKIKAAEHIQTNAGEANGRDRVVVHRNDCRCCYGCLQTRASDGRRLTMHPETSRSATTEAGIRYGGQQLLMFGD
jgi:hypothetical protein